MARFRSSALAAALTGTLLAGCSDSATRPDPDIVEPLEIDASINVQLQDAPPGVRPFYIVTGRASAVQGDVERAAAIDSVVAEYSLNAGEWKRLRRTSILPFSDVLPFVVSAGDAYRLRARLFASATDAQGTRHTATVEWIASAGG